MTENQIQTKEPSLIDALIPVIMLVILLAASVYMFGDNSSYGPNQIALVFAAAVAALVGLKNGYKWKQIEQGMVKGITTALGAMLILLAVGMLIGSWILSGTVPAMIYYGLQLLEPSFFYAAACAICALVSVSIGSSWTTAATIGIGLIGTASGLGLSLEITAGAIISGAYFGDKMSPLSDTTNLAPAVTGAELFEHIRNMFWTTAPSIVIALILFTILGFTESVNPTTGDLSALLNLLDSSYAINLHLLIPLFILLFLAYKRMPALPTLFIGTVVGVVFAVLFQWDGIVKQAGNEQDFPVLRSVWSVLHEGYKASLGDDALNDLLSRGGMASMLNTIWLIMCALVFGAIMERTGLLLKLVSGALSLAQSTGSLIFTTILTCIGINAIAADQYIAIVLPGRMYKLEFERRGLAPKNLSRILEDSATITSPLIPWNTCGVYMAGTLGVATFAYLPYCFFNIINPIISIIYGFTGFKVIPLDKTESSNPGSEPEVA